MQIVNLKPTYTPLRGRLLAFGFSLASLAMAGCGLGSGNSVLPSATGTPTSARGTISGTVYGGSQPIIGATIQVYAINASTRKGAATPLLTQAVTTQSPNGSFSISGLYYLNCTPTSQIYITATGGNSGGGTNSAIALMAPLGLCSTVYSNAQNGINTTVTLNEVSVIGTVYALASYMSGYANVGTTSATDTGYANAVANFYNMVNLQTGLAGGTTLPTGAVLPTAEINTLANMIASCVGSSSNTSTSCTSLLGATGATDTVGAALYFAKNPTSPALIALYSSLSPPTVPFQPTLSAAPSDWTVAIKYNGSGNLSGPYGVAIDSSGNAWVSNSTGSTISELSANGTYVNSFTATGLVGPKGLAIDRNKNVWVTNPTGNNVYEFNSTGTYLGNAGVQGGPVAIAMDSQGNAWVANLTGNSVTELSSSLGNLQAGLTGSGTISAPSGIALDSTGNVYVANNGGGNVIKLTHAGALSATLTDNALQGTTALALDTSNNLVATGSTTGTAVTGSVSQFTSAGTAASGSPLSGSGITLPGGIAWAGINTGSGATSFILTNSITAGSISGISISGGVGGLIGPVGSLNQPVGVAVDLSGNVWTANVGDSTVSEFMGLGAVPVTTPIAATVGP